MAKELFTTNAVCRKKYCINPAFPALNDLSTLEQATWVATTHSAVMPYLSFCKDPVNYDPALPSPADASGTPLNELAQKQEDAAVTAYFYHLSGMGFDGWDYPEPSQADECIQAVWKMACFTYFPRSQPGVSEGAATAYLRPCSSTCENYKSKCAVECCDESTQCVFSHTAALLGTNQTVNTQGYVNAQAPSALCTGAARLAGPLPVALLGALLLALWRP